MGGTPRPLTPRPLMAIDLVFETHAMTEDNETGRAPGLGVPA